MRTGRRNLADSLRSLRATLVQIEKGQGLLHDIVYGKSGGELIDRVDRTAKALERIVHGVETEGGLLHALIYAPQEETLGRLTRLADNLNQTVDQANLILRDAREGPGLLHALIYDREAGTLLDRLSRTSEQLERMVQSIRDGQGLLPALLFDPERTKVLDDVESAAASIRASTADLQSVVARLRQGEGTLGGLLEDPTVYEDLSALLRGANRSFLLRSLIRSTREEGLPEKKQP